MWNVIMWLVIVFLVVLVIVMLSIIILYKRQIRDITNQIKAFKDRESNKKVNIQIIDKDIEKLACEINEYFEVYIKNECEKTMFEMSLYEGITNISHDLRTPLTAIIGYLKLLENNQINEVEAMTVLKNKSERLKFLIDNFFEFAKIENTQYELNKERINLGSLMENEILALYNNFQERNITLEVEIERRDIFINASKEATERIIGNLLENALKYSEEYVKVDLYKKNKNVYLEIKNPCNSLTNEDAKKIFDKFYMANRVRNSTGTGLGLAIVKNLMEKSDGVVVSELKNGILRITCVWKGNSEK